MNQRPDPPYDNGPEGGIIEPKRAPQPCIYCGAPVIKIGRGEHIVPKSIGGTRYLRCVCRTCNESFSRLEKELVSRSPLAILVQQEYGTAGGLMWGYDHARDLALEARPSQGFLAPLLWPQLVLLGDKPLFFFDYEEARLVGVEAFVGAFAACLKAAWQSVLERPDRAHWIWERIREAPDRGRFPPRVFTEHSYHEFGRDITFKCRYLGNVDRGRVLYQVRKWTPDLRRGADSAPGVHDLRTCYCYSRDSVLRTLVKLGINLLVDLAGPERVNRKTFDRAISYVRTGGPRAPSHAQNGFVHNADIQPLKCPADCHRFCLSHSGRGWVCDYAFFGGRLGATVSFPGPRVGSWAWAEITAPYNAGSEWMVHQSPITPARRMRVEWSNLPCLLPSVYSGDPKALTQ